MATLTNTKASQASIGQAVIVTLSLSEANTYLGTLVIGQQCIVNSSGNVGYIYSIDSGGISFKIKTKYMSSALESSTTGYLSASDTITV